MSKHHERGRGNPLNDILKGIDINQVISLMSSLGMNKGNNNTSNRRMPNAYTGNKGGRDAQDFAKLLANPKFLDIVNSLSRKINDKNIDEQTKQDEIKNAFNRVNALIKRNRS
ncbi:hypothetical protein D4Z93_03970 [Clostridium fermenticellae]|uniref:Uncharacterized protein n=1 Tax=Clostridium fermenticellae TaxID=2068654 RepID=A0A386H1Y2_9CLOT|nr:hypothetical protein [Clostridium fermenticellae]AYD39721.1 hypothetical protein D4Z93_03970 [Clostridium fermenticellae]